jgi:Anticodon binding domain
MRSHTAARPWIPPSWNTSTNTISYARGLQRLAYTPWHCVVKDTSRTRFLTRQHPSRVFFSLPDLLRVPFNSTFTSLEYIEKIILILQGRLVTLMDLPTAAPYFFVSPAWNDAEARAMLGGISLVDYQAAIRGTVSRLRSTSLEDVHAVTDALHAENRAGEIKPARFMTALRHAMSGMKVRLLVSQKTFSCKANHPTQNGPSVAELMVVLGTQRTIARLEEADNSCHAWFLN